MARRSLEQVKGEIESERERLERAVRTLRSQASGARRRLPVVVLSALGTGFVFAGGPRSLLRLVFLRRRAEKGKRSRGRFSFLNRS